MLKNRLIIAFALSIVLVFSAAVLIYLRTDLPKKVPVRAKQVQLKDNLGTALMCKGLPRIG